ncbi:MAG: hypothetical protein LBP53_07125 [Candidatus Peribacteria bacterium]|jgi:hypothetical protein|nr:hypothetical protein [Candidatus Peribacteria bacterium]
MTGASLSIAEQEQISNAITKVSSLDFGAVATTLSGFATTLSGNTACITGLID